jgi:hypothetical protein
MAQRSDEAPLLEKVKVGFEELVGPLGPERICRVGGAESTVKVLEAGVPSTLPARSTARTWKVCGPSASGESTSYSLGPQEAKAAASSLHSKRARSSSELYPKAGVVSLVVSAGPVSIVVSGGVVSTVKARVAGERSGLPAPLIALTLKV